MATDERKRMLLFLIEGVGLFEEEPHEMEWRFQSYSPHFIVLLSECGLLRICPRFFLLRQTPQPLFAQRMFASWFFAARGKPAIDQLVTASKALSFQLLPKLVGIAASLGQSFFQVREIWVNETFASSSVGSLMKRSRVDRGAHGTPAYPQLVGNTQNTHALLGEGHHFFIVCLASETRDLGGGYFRLTAPSFVRWCLR